DRSRSDLSFYYYGFANCSSGTYYYPVPACNDLSGAGQGDHVAALNELLLGLTEGSGRSFGVTNRRIFQKSLGLYVQDSWKVKPNFTLELGVRWDVAGALGEAKNQGANFLPDSPKADANGFVSLSQQPLYGVDKNNFGPRVGFAPGVRIYGQAATPTPPFNVVQLVRNIQTPLNRAYNLTIEQELSHNTAVSVAYVGTAGRDLVNSHDLNACPVSPLKCASSTV